MKLISLFFLLMLLAVTFVNTAFSQTKKEAVHGNKIIETEKRPFEDFDAIEVNKGIVVSFKEGERELQVKAEGNLLPYIITKIIDRKLIVDTKPNVALVDIQPIEIFISSTPIALKYIKAASGGSVTFGSPLKVESLEIKLTGGSTLDAEIICKKLNLDMQGGVMATIIGSADLAEINVQGGSTLAGKKLQIQFCSITAEGNSKAHVDVKKEISAKATGVSKIKYSSKPVFINKEVTGLSVVKR